MSTETPIPFERLLEDILRRIEDGRIQLRIPPETKLYSKQPRSHFHTTPELFLQTGGATEFSCPDADFTLKTGDLCLIPKGVPHAETPIDRRTPYGVLVVIQSSNGCFLHRGRMDPAHRIQGYGTMLVPSARARQAFGLLDELAAAVKTIGPLGRRLRIRLLETFLLIIFDELQHFRAGDHGEPSIPALVHETEKLVHTHLASVELSIAGLAKSLGCSADHLSRNFHQTRGQSLAAWIVRERVRRAKELLRNPALNISEIAWACGFASPSYFIHVFKRAEKITPRAYRLRLLTGTH